MSRHIELVFDNSGSMANDLAGETRLEVAKRIFQDEIFPVVGFPGDEVYLRLLRPNCYGQSTAIALGTDRNRMHAAVMNIVAGGSTPLFNTIKDAVEACKSSNALEKIIFILTDGDDTCGAGSLENFMQAEDLNTIKLWNVMLVQFAVSDIATQHNLTAFCNRIGAKTFSVANGYNTDYSEIRSTMKQALHIGGLMQGRKISPCFTHIDGPRLAWPDLQVQGIEFHLSTLLYEEGFLSWEPEWSKSVDATSLAELRFVYGLRFKTGLAKELVATMLKQLIKPYYYSMDCIYWDFAEARWKHHYRSNDIDPVENPNAYVETMEINKNDYEDDVKYYREGITYVVKLKEENSINLMNNGNGRYWLDENRDDVIKGRVKTLKAGQLVRFKRG